MRLKAWVYPTETTIGFFDYTNFGVSPDYKWWQYADQGYYINTEGEEKEFKVLHNTGRKDRKGNPIWEGDVLRRFKKNGQGYKKVTIVTGPYEGTHCLRFLYESEVIGNIYEDPQYLTL